ncbi:MAG: TetR/AcrR family transcriptional regulator [Acidobacteria bacterium]|nr:TetR/AcrR family transcriptional regulator [Acidobacteriota bacterium]
MTSPSSSAAADHHGTNRAAHPSSSAERILRTALDLFAVKGYDATAVREICEAAGITRPTLYHFYGSKEGVLEALVASGFSHFRTMVEGAISHDGTFRDRVKLLARAVFDSATRQPRLWRFIHGFVWAPPATVRSDRVNCTEFYDGMVRALGAAAEEAVRFGELAPGPTGTRMLVLMGALSEAATGYVIAGRPELTPQLADQLVDAIFDGWNR